MSLAVAGPSPLLYRCLECRLVQPESFPTVAELAEYYRRYSYDLDASWRIDAATQASLKELARFLRRYQKKSHTDTRIIDAMNPTEWCG